MFSFLFFIEQSVGQSLNIPGIKAGTAKITGRLIMSNDSNKDSNFVDIAVSYPISGERAKYKTRVDESGEFSIDTDVETDISLVGLNTSLNPEKVLYVKLISGGVTHIEIAYNSSFDIENIDVRPAMNKNDMSLGVEAIGKVIEHRPNRLPKPLYDKSPDEFLNHAKFVVSERLAILNHDTLLSKEFKVMLSKDFHLFMYVGHVFDYEGAMMLNYRNTNADKDKKPDFHKIDRSYYRFLKDFNLNDPEYLLCFALPEFQKGILQNEILGIPVIGDSDIPTWLAGVKVVLSDLVGFDKGPYYDILAANAYGRQLNEEVRPLSEKQKKNIENYWGKGEIAKILFRKNQKVIELNKFKSPAVVNDISTVSNDKIIETILSKHKGKVVFIDLWATWCAPCLDAMQQFRSVKNELSNQDIAFVYLTNGSSPRKLWEEKIKGIGDEHYYLTNPQWEYIMNHFELEYIPSYLLYDTKGVLINKFSAFPGNEQVKDMIKGLL